MKIQCKWHFFVLMSCLLLIRCFSYAEFPEKANRGVREANSWLSLVDKQNYEQSWHDGSKLFQEKISVDDWITALNMSRKPLGNPTSRNLQNWKSQTNPRGLPEGDYLVIEYNTKFKGQTEETESLILRLEDDGTWKVLSYIIH